MHATHADHCSQVAVFLDQRFSKIEAALKKKPRDIEETKELEEYLTNVPNDIRPLQEFIDEMRLMAAVLDGFEYRGRVLNSNVKESRKKKWVERPAVDPATLDDGGLFEALDTLPDKFAIQEYGLEKIRNACKKARIKAGGDLEQCTARLLKIRGLKPEVYLDPAFGLIPTRNNRRNARWN